MPPHRSNIPHRAEACPRRTGIRGCGFTLVEVALSLVLMGVLSLVVARSASSYLQIFQSSHTVSDLSQKEWVAASRIQREVREASPDTIQVDPDGQGFSFCLIAQQGIVEETDHKKDWISTFSEDAAKIPAGARIFFRHKQARNVLETQVSKVEPPQQKGQPFRIYYPDKAPGVSSIQAGDRFWVLGSPVAFRKVGTQVFREEEGENGTDAGIPNGNGNGNHYGQAKGKNDVDPSAPSQNGALLVDTVNRFQASWKGTGEPFFFELFLFEDDTEVGGAYQAVPLVI
jgi:prepilin-type N-terminal cleavage/methylation domain-containing protein